MADFSSAENSSVIVAKIVPPATVSLASIAGYQVSDLVLWVTLIYTLLLCGHKAWQILRDISRGGPSE